MDAGLNFYKNLFKGNFKEAKQNWKDDISNRTSNEGIFDTIATAKYIKNKIKE